MGGGTLRRPTGLHGKINPFRLCTIGSTAIYLFLLYFQKTKTEQKQNKKKHRTQASLWFSRLPRVRKERGAEF